jgi:hypothetical protein
MGRSAHFGDCARCGQALGERATFQFQTPSGVMRTCFACAVRDAPTLRRSGLIALTVGTLLTAINQGDVLLAGHWTPWLLWKIPLTYAVPFVVATLGALGTRRVQDRR